jgi:hypothetical protein
MAHFSECVEEFHLSKSVECVPVGNYSCEYCSRAMTMRWISDVPS